MQLQRSVFGAYLLSNVANATIPGASVEIANGTVTGVTDATTGIQRFLGIPYAEAPVDELRLHQAIPRSSPFGTFQATEHGPACYGLGNDQYEQSEDCLTLNIWRPAAADQEKLPVLVWLYGGSLRNGYTAIFPGIFERQGDGRWVKENIGAFGGDPAKLTLFGQSAGVAAALPLDSPQPNCLDGPRGGGPYPACITTSPALPNHTIYYPLHAHPNPHPHSHPLPILAWANGGYSSNGTSFANFLANIASHGFLVIASGPPNGSDDAETTAEYLSDAIDWALALSSSSTKVGLHTAEKVPGAAAGQSCGGLHAYSLRNDERVAGLGIFNSGLLRGESLANNPIQGGVEDASVIAEVRKPVFWFMGGAGDVAYPNAVADYAELPEGLPKWIGQYYVGHSGTYQEESGGAFGVAALKWLQWLLKGDEEAARFYEEGGVVEAGWTDVEGENLEQL